MPKYLTCNNSKIFLPATNNKARSIFGLKGFIKDSSNINNGEINGFKIKGSLNIIELNIVKYPILPRIQSSKIVPSKFIFDMLYIN